MTLKTSNSQITRLNLGFVGSKGHLFAGALKRVWLTKFGGKMSGEGDEKAL